MMSSFTIVLLILAPAVTIVRTVDGVTPTTLLAVVGRRSSPAAALRCRGGGAAAGRSWWHKFWKPVTPYEKVVQEQNLLLERRIRHSQEELTNLRNRMKEVQSGAISQQAATIQFGRKETERKQRKKELKLLIEQVAELERTVAELEAMKVKLEELLETKDQEIRFLEEKIIGEATHNTQLRQHYELKLEQVRKELEAAATEQLEELRKVLLVQQEEAVALAKEQAALELQRAVEKTEARVQQRAERELLEVQQKAEEAVEREKSKMRKLVKAIAEREKRTVERDEKQRPKVCVSTPTMRRNVIKNAGFIRSPVK
jgi:hypothetical protein